MVAQPSNADPRRHLLDLSQNLHVIFSSSIKYIKPCAFLTDETLQAFLTLADITIYCLCMLLHRDRKIDYNLFKMTAHTVEH